jgi:hypothetical protein
MDDPFTLDIKKYKIFQWLDKIAYFLGKLGKRLGRRARNRSIMSFSTEFSTGLGDIPGSRYRRRRSPPLTSDMFVEGKAPGRHLCATT